ncbi:acetyltransferase [Clostridium tyrobutyricum]|uniref:acetyltransferase n=1 Tax=Clostridium tyrobutyricum TaxID=1519 RepID=UPI0010AAB9CF|nr:acetyltransferase [Clostridium tyrobutyricum]QCH26952.1 Putative acetyltransferase EpsM [Clostridium tyrobutyricum]
MKKIVLVGAGGHCKVIIDLIESLKEYDIFGITDQKKQGTILNYKIVGNDDELQSIYKSGVHYAFICVGGITNLSVRNNIYLKLKNLGFNIPTLIHKDSIISPYAHVGDGTCIMAGAIVNAGAHIGENCIINTGSVIEHDCKIGNNTHVSPNAALSGGTKIGCNTHIGIGSSIIQGVAIGDNVTIGAGSVVIENIPDNVVSVGVPSKIIKIKK